MKCRKFNFEKDAIIDFINLPKRIYNKNTNMENPKQMRELLLNNHTLSKYFQLDKFLIYDNNDVVGRFCITTYKDDMTAYIGFIEFVNDKKIANFLFEKAYDFVKEKGYKKIVGPVDASFWIKYRLKINLFDCIPYTGEPYNRDYYFKFFVDNKYKVVEHYTSNAFSVIDKFEHNEKIENRYKEFNERGYKIISPKIKNFDNLIDELYCLIIDLYSDFPTFKLVSAKDFKELFKSYKYIINPEMIKMAYYKQKAVGFFVSIPNYYNEVYHISLSNIFKILKLKRKPNEYIMLYMGVDRAHRGLGKALLGAIVEELKNIGLPSIGALIRDGKITNTYGREIVYKQYEYVLMECDIGD